MTLTEKRYAIEFYNDMQQAAAKFEKLTGLDMADVKDAHKQIYLDFVNTENKRSHEAQEIIRSFLPEEMVREENGTLYVDANLNVHRGQI